MRIVGNNIAVLDGPDQLSRWVEESGRLCHDDGVAMHYLPHIKPGDVVIDAGAAIGDHTIAYAQATGNPANVHAFECNPYMVECLRHNCPGVHVYPFALSVWVGMLPFCQDKDGNYGAGYISYPENSSEHKSVIGLPLDSLYLDRVDFIKLDIEGFEFRALLGGRDTIRRCRPKMIVEIYDAHLKRAGFSSVELEKLITSYGYTITPIMGDPKEGRYEALCIPE